MTTTWSTAAAAFLAQLSARAPAPDEPAWLTARRRAAAAQFTACGLPEADDEEWRATDLKELTAQAFASPAALAATATPGLVAGGPDWPQCYRVVVVNGRLGSVLPADLPRGVVLLPLRRAWVQHEALVRPALAATEDPQYLPFAALNTALFEDGVFLHVPAGVVVDRPFHVLFLTTETTRAAIHPRLVVSLGPGTQAVVIEDYRGVDGSAYLCNSVSDLVLAENARLEHDLRQRQGNAAFHLGLVQARQAAGTRLATNCLTAGGRLARTETRVQLTGPEAECTMNGVYLAAGDQVLDCHTHLAHLAPHGVSRETYKGIVGDHARAIFNGRIYVPPGAVQTDAEQTSHALVLSDEARVFARPQLEILADDVRCAHGATVGHLDDEALFYLRARGVDRDTARHILTRAFTAGALAAVSPPALVAEVDELVAAKFFGLAADSPGVGAVPPVAIASEVTP